MPTTYYRCELSPTVTVRTTDPATAEQESRNGARVTAVMVQ